MKYRVLRNASAQYELGVDVPVRPMLPSITQFLIAMWVLGKTPMCSPHKCPLMQETLPWLVQERIRA